MSEHPFANRIDELTGFLKREVLLNRLKKSAYFEIYLINIDDFSSINDFYGGAVGDDVIKSVANKIKHQFSKEYSFYRLQADEYVVIFDHGVSDISKIDFSDKLIMLSNGLCGEYFLEDTLNASLHIEVTIGFDCGQTLNILRNANLAYKTARQTFKKVCVFEESMLSLQKEQEENRKNAKIVKEAIVSNFVTPYYQSIICNLTGKAIKYEALARISDDNKLFLTPNQFLETSNKIKMAREITKCMITKTLHDFNGINIGVSINLCYEDILDTSIVKLIEEQLKSFHEPKYITFELVETSKIKDYQIINDFIKMLKQFNASISIDDFGAEYSNFSHLANIDIDYLKIDGQFVCNIFSSKNKSIIESIVSYCRKNNIKTIAEFVENKSIFLTLKEIGVDYSQGFLFSKPKPFNELNLKEKR